LSWVCLTLQGEAAVATDWEFRSLQKHQERVRCNIAKGCVTALHQGRTSPLSSTAFGFAWAVH